jgi:hypothetical protein
MLRKFNGIVSILYMCSMDKRPSRELHFYHMKKFKWFISTLVFLSLSTAHGAMFKYNELMIKDYDEMSQLVQGFLKKARGQSDDGDISDAEAVDNLREAVKLIFSRPNSDNMIAKLIPEVRRELIGLNSFESVISSLSAEALDVAKNKNAAPSAQATSLFVLENILSEIRPEVARNPDMRGVIERIKKADLDVSTAVIKDLKLRGMFKARNPSETAAEILSNYAKEEKKKKKAEKEAKKDKKPVSGDEYEND